ncbi:MAG: DNA-directed RNA polymerase subunit omega [Cloacibacillus sp.]
MIYMDLEKIYKEQNIPNKYILTLVISARSRQLSERKDFSGEEKYITQAVKEVTEGKLRYKIIDPVPASKTDNEPAA